VHPPGSLWRRRSYAPYTLSCETNIHCCPRRIIPCALTGSKCLYLWNSYLLITSAVLMLLSVVVWITSCQNNFVSYLDTIGQTPELMNRVTLWSRYIEVGCILAIVSTVSCNKPALRACLRLQNNWKCNIFRVLPTSHTAWKRAFWT